MNIKIEIADRDSGGRGFKLGLFQLTGEQTTTKVTRIITERFQTYNITEEERLLLSVFAQTLLNSCEAESTQKLADGDFFSNGK